MSYVKRLGLAIAAAAALMAFVGNSTASATVFCKTAPIAGSGETTGTICPGGWAYPAGQSIHAVLKPGKKAKLKTEFKTIECEESTLQSETNAEEGEPLGGPEGTLTFGKCNCEVKVLKAGTNPVHWIRDTHTGQITGSGSEVTTTCSTIFGNVHCIYVTENTVLGTITGGNPAVVDASAEIPRLTTNALCSKEALWEAEYEITTPKPLFFSGHT